MVVVRHPGPGVRGADEQSGQVGAVFSAVACGLALSELVLELIEAWPKGAWVGRAIGLPGFRACGVRRLGRAIRHIDLEQFRDHGEPLLPSADIGFPPPTACVAHGRAHRMLATHGVGQAIEARSPRYRFTGAGGTEEPLIVKQFETFSPEKRGSLWSPSFHNRCRAQ